MTFEEEVELFVLGELNNSEDVVNEDYLLSIVTRKYGGSAYDIINNYSVERLIIMSKSHKNDNYGLSLSEMGQIKYEKLLRQQRKEKREPIIINTTLIVAVIGSLFSVLQYFKIDEPKSQKPQPKQQLQEKTMPSPSPTPVTDLPIPSQKKTNKKGQQSDSI